MKKLKEFFDHPIIQIALATGISILIMAYVSKRILPEPMSDTVMAISPFIATLFGAVYSKYKEKRFCTPWYWVVAILAATWLVILYHMP